MDQTPSVMSPPSEIGKSTLEVRARKKAARRTIVFALLGLVVLAGAGVYVLDPWHWRTGGSAPSAAVLWEEAQKAMDEREFALARDRLAQCLEILPFNAEAHFLIARAWRREQGRNYLGPWQSHLFEANELQWSQEQIEFETQLQHAQSGDVWSVEPPLLDSLTSRSAPEVEMTLEALAEGYLKNHSLAKLLELTNWWLERFPDDWLPHLYRANLQAREGTRAKAIEEYQMVLRLNPDHDAARLQLAETLMDDGQLKESLALFESYLKENPRDPTALYGVANCQYSSGKLAAARAALKEIFRVSKNSIKPLLLQAKIEYADDQPAEALRWLRQAERLAPSEPDITHTILICLQRLNRTEEAEKYMKRHQEILELHDQLIKVRKQLRRDPFNVELRYQIGKVNMLLSRDDEAYEWFQMVLRLDPKHAETLQALEEWRERNPEPAVRTGGPAGK
jgi:tetratricopeptide (TPR) repeat protein